MRYPRPCFHTVLSSLQQLRDFPNQRQRTALVKTPEYLNAHFPNQYTAAFQKEETISGETYLIMDVRTNAGENQVTMEPTLAVKASHGSLWAYYPDGNLVDAAQDQLWKSKA